MKSLRTTSHSFCSAITLLLMSFCLTTHAQNPWTFGSATTNVWSEPLNWGFNAVPTSFDPVLFDNNTAAATNVPGAVNNVMDFSTEIASINWTGFYNSGLGGSPGVTFTTNFHTTYIPSGATLSISPAGGSGNLLHVGTGTHEGDDARVVTTLTGGGNLVIGNFDTPAPGSMVRIGQGVSANSSDHRSTLDLSGLSSFTCGVSNFYIGDAFGVGSLIKNQATVILAKTNHIRVNAVDANGTFRIGFAQTSQARGNELWLGQTNAIFTDYLRVCQRANGGLIRFQAGLNNPSVYFRSPIGGRMAQFNVSEGRSQTANNNMSASVDTTGGNIDLMVSTMIVSYAPNSASAAASSTGVFTMDAGLVDATGLFIAFQGQNNVAPCTGTVNLNGTGKIVAGNITLGRDAGSAAGTATGIINISNTATLTVIGSLAENNLVNGSGSSTINLNGGTLSVGTTLRVDALNVTNGTLTVAIANTVTDANPAWIATNLNLASVTLNVQGSGFALGRYPLIKYTGVIGGNGYAAIVPGTLPPRTQGYLSNNVANSSIDVVVTNVSFAKWNGNISGDWNTNTANWIDSGTLAATTYSENTIPGDSAIFDNSATGTRVVNLTTTLTPTAVAVTNSGTPYVFNGSGRLTGSMALSKSGSGTLVLTNAGLNDFVGAVNVNAGTLRLGLAPDRLPTNALVNMADVPGAVLELGGQDQTINTLAGGGPSGGNVDLGANTLTLKGGSTYSGVISGSGALRKTAGALTLGGPSTYTGGTFITAGSLTVINTNGSGVGNGPVDIAAGLVLNIGNGGNGGDISGATFITNKGVMFFNSTNENTVNASIEGTGDVLVGGVSSNVNFTAANTYSGYTSITNGALRISHSDALGDLGGTTGMSIYSHSARLELMGNITVYETIDPSQKSFGYGDAPNFVNVSGTNALSGAINVFAGGTYWSFRSDTGKLIVNGTFNNFTTSGSGRTLRLYGPGDGEWSTPVSAGIGSTTHLLKHGLGTWTLSGPHFYNGNTLAYGGNLIVNGEIQSLGVVEVGSLDFAHPYVPGGVPATFGGSVIVQGSVTVNTNGILTPGSSIGTMSISNTLTTSGTIVMEVNTDTLEHDVIIAATGVTYGGTLVISPSGLGTAITNGASAKLFDAASYSGAFAAIVPASPGPGLSWDTSQLTVSGTLAITSGPNTTPTNLVLAVTGGGTTLDISWPSTHIGWRLQAQTNSLNFGISNNWFTVGGSTTTNHVVLPINPANGSVFFRMIYP